MLISILTFTILNPALSSFENCVDPYQLASQKPADLDLHCFLTFLLMHGI